MTSTWRLALAATATCALATACSEARLTEEASRVVSMDSAGVKVTEVHGSPEAFGLFSLGDTAERTISGPFGSNEEFLLGVSAAFVVPSDNGLVVLSRSARAILVFDSTGSFLHAVGTPGEGPGELSGYYGLFPCGDDRFWVAEGGRASLFRVSGTYVRSTLPGSLGGAPEIQGSSSDCTSLWLVEATLESTPEAGRVGSLSGRGSWLNTITGERSEPVGFRRAQVLGRESFGAPISLFPWSESAFWDVAGDLAYVGEGERAELRAWDVAGRLAKVIRLPDARQPLTRADRTAYAARRQRLIERRPSSAEIWPELDEVPLPDTKPVLVDLLVSDDGELWLQRYPDWSTGMYGSVRVGSEGDPPGEWWVIDPGEGRFARVEVPAHLRLLAIAGNKAYAVAQDTLGVERIEIYRVERGPNGRSDPDS